MSKFILFAATIVFLCLGIVYPAQAQKKKQATTATAKKDVKFLNDITVQASPDANATTDPKAVFSHSIFTSDKKTSDKKVIATNSETPSIEKANSLQLKYALLLDVEVEQVLNLSLFKLIDEWIGVKYHLGGSTKDGIDCSALTQILFTSLYGITLPRTAREQYDFCRKISRTQLKEGDLVFFNTIGGVSHVGMYLTNNKFIHASTGGVTISDLFDEYWSRKFIGVGRIDQPEQTTTASTIKP